MRKASHIPIVNDESSNFLYNERFGSAFAIHHPELTLGGQLPKLGKAKVATTEGHQETQHIPSIVTG